MTKLDNEVITRVMIRYHTVNNSWTESDSRELQNSICWSEMYILANSTIAALLHIEIPQLACRVFMFLIFGNVVMSVRGSVPTLGENIPYQPLLIT